MKSALMLVNSHYQSKEANQALYYSKYSVKFALLSKGSPNNSIGLKNSSFSTSTSISRGTQQFHP